MMAEQKGRGGKKPKYQIADIGGSNLTAQDISTERVLNFLIKGESPAADEGADPSGVGLDQERAAPEHTSDRPRLERSDSSLPSPSAPSKKSLDHLFRRASAGSGARDIKPEPREQEHPEIVPASEEIKTVEPVQLEPRPFQAKEGPSPVMLPPPPLITAEPSATPLAPPPSEPEVRSQVPEPQELKRDTAAAAAGAENAELTQLTSLWKSFYRLKDGEIEALSVMYQMSHGLGSDECYVKMQKLAEMSNLTYRYCQKVVRSLEQLGWITKLNDYDPATQLGVLYRVNLKPSI